MHAHLLVRERGAALCRVGVEEAGGIVVLLRTPAAPAGRKISVRGRAQRLPGGGEGVGGVGREQGVERVCGEVVGVGQSKLACRSEEPSPPCNFLDAVPSATGLARLYSERDA